MLNVCGDGIVGPYELCDVGTYNGQTDAVHNPTNCTANCTFPGCGDHQHQAGEQCDNGATNGTATDNCTARCVNALCGDGTKSTGEECDDGANNTLNTACLPTCKAATCGDGYIRTGVEECDAATSTSAGHWCPTTGANACKRTCSAASNFPINPTINPTSGVSNYLAFSTSCLMLTASTSTGAGTAGICPTGSSEISITSTAKEAAVEAWITVPAWIASTSTPLVTDQTAPYCTSANGAHAALTSPASTYSCWHAYPGSPWVPSTTVDAAGCVYMSNAYQGTSVAWSWFKDACTTTKRQAICEYPWPAKGQNE
jgi:hypothetical protein